MEMIGVITSIPNLTNYSLSGLIIICSLLLIWNVRRITPEVSYKNLQFSTQVLYSTIIIFTTILLIILWGLGQSFTAVLLAVLTLLIPVIARKTLKNTIAGIQIAYLEPFSENDWINVDNREGIVKKLTLNNTIIQSPDGEDIVIPNSFLIQNVVINKSEGGNLKQSVEITVPLSNEPEYIKDIAEEVLRETDSVLQIPRPQIHIVNINESKMTIGIQYWIDKPHRRQIIRTRDEIMKGIRNQFIRESVFTQNDLN